MFKVKTEAKAEAMASRPRPRLRAKFWPQGHFGLDDLTPLQPDVSTTHADAHKFCEVWSTELRSSNSAIGSTEMLLGMFVLHAR